VFGRALAQEVLAAPRHITAKQLVSAHRHETILVPTEERGTIEDIDTPADYERIAGETLEAALARAAERKGGLPLKK
jgi:CTP:molybdopterin cytidylyltransferase MocA